MNRPFPQRRLDTITRANIISARATGESLDTADKLADYFCGVGANGRRFAQTRHVQRCEKLRTFRATTDDTVDLPPAVDAGRRNGRTATKAK